MIKSKNFRRIIKPVLAALLLYCGACFAETDALGEFTNTDRILILAPHPDDEIIGTAGVIQKALKKDLKIKVALFTNGDQNELSFILTKKRIPLRKKEFMSYGETRIKESLAAGASLGLARDDIIILGYPDFWTLEIMFKYWGKTKPFRSILTRISEVSSPEAMSPGAPYVGESILKDLEKIILDFKPTKIFVSHPADTNKDHRALYLFLKVALWDLEGKINTPEILPYIVHVGGWPAPKGYRPGLELNPPDTLDGIAWKKIFLDENEIKAKRESTAFFKTQNIYNKGYLYSFARKNELFGDYPIIKLEKEKKENVNWYYLRDGISDSETTHLRKDISSLAYRVDENNIYVKLILRRKMDKDFGVSIYLLGFKKGVIFPDMPKIHAFLDIFGLHISDKKKKIFDKNCNLETEGRASSITIPLYLLGNPDYILSCAKTKGSALPMDETAWRIIELE